MGFYFVCALHVKQQNVVFFFCILILLLRLLCVSFRAAFLMQIPNEFNGNVRWSNLMSYLHLWLTQHFLFYFYFFFVFPICFEMLKMCVARGEHYVAISLARHNKSSIYRQLCWATVVVLLSKLIYIKPWTILIHRHDDSFFCCCFGCNGEPNVMPHFHLVLCSIYNWVMWLSNNLVIYQRAEATNSGKLYISWY